MRHFIPRVLRFDNRNPDSTPLYPMPLPAGMRVVGVVNGNDVKMYSTNGVNTNGDITGFAPTIESTLRQLHEAMLSEPLPGITENGKLKYRPGMAFDLILHDRHGNGAADKVLAAFDDWCVDEEWPVKHEDVCALVLAAMPLQAFMDGRDTCDIWMRRSHVMRGCMRLGMANIYANPHPTIRPATMAPDSWASPAYGCAGRSGKMFWQQVENCFKHGYVGCLIVDVMQPWDYRGNAFQLITEEDYI